MKVVGGGGDEIVEVQCIRFWKSTRVVARSFGDINVFGDIDCAQISCIVDGCDKQYATFWLTNIGIAMTAEGTIPA